MPNTANLLRNKPSIVEKAYQGHSETQVPTTHRCPPGPIAQYHSGAAEYSGGPFCANISRRFAALAMNNDFDNHMCVARATRFQNTTQGVNGTGIL